MTSLFIYFYFKDQRDHRECGILVDLYIFTQYTSIYYQALSQGSQIT